MSRKLYKVKVETELMVMGLDKKDAEAVARKNAPNEISEYGTCSVALIQKSSDVPSDWKDIIPYTSEGVIQDHRKCKEISEEVQVETCIEDLDEVIRIQKNSKKTKKETKKKDETLPETRPDPQPTELNWRDTQSGRPLPHLKFDIPKRNDSI